MKSLRLTAGQLDPLPCLKPVGFPRDILRVHSGNSAEAHRLQPLVADAEEFTVRVRARMSIRGQRLQCQVSDQSSR
jgi:hypothetical protein